MAPCWHLFMIDSNKLELSSGQQMAVNKPGSNGAGALTCDDSNKRAATSQQQPTSQAIGSNGTGALMMDSNRQDSYKSAAAIKPGCRQQWHWGTYDG